MNDELTFEGYTSTKEKLAQMEARLAALQERIDLHPLHRDEVRHSYEDMMRQYRHYLKLYEGAHPSEFPEQASPQVGVPTEHGKTS